MNSATLSGGRSSYFAFASKIENASPRKSNPAEPASVIHSPSGLRLFIYRHLFHYALCPSEREMIFLDDRIQTIIKTAWKRIPKLFPGVHLDEWILMPNHLHGILVIQERARHLQCDGIEQPLEEKSLRSGIQLPFVNASPLPGGPLIPGSLGAILGNLKSITARKINGYRKTPGAPVWQRNYFEHIIRSDASLERHRKYIRENPQNWVYDEENPEMRAAVLTKNRG